MLLLLPSEVRIAVDVDGVILDTPTKWMEVYNRKYRTNHTTDVMTNWNSHVKLGISKKEFFKILKTACKEIEFIQPCFELAPYYMFLLKQKNHVDIVTGSVAKRGLLIGRLEQLHIRQGYEYNELIQLPPDNKFAKLNLKYDIYVDDNPNLATEIDGYGLQGGRIFQVLVTQPWNKYYQPKRNVMRAYNWEDINEGIELFRVILEIKHDTD